MNTKLKKKDFALDQEKTDIKLLMSQIRDRVKNDYENLKDTKKEYKPLNISNDLNTKKAGQLLYSEELRYLNSNYAFGPTLDVESISSHRPGIIGKIIVKVKRKFLGVIWDLFKSYFAKEKEFNANLVRYLNDVSKYVDERDASNFWELIKKIDYDITKTINRIDQVSDETTASLYSTEKRIVEELISKNLQELQKVITNQGSDIQKNKADLEVLNSVTKGLESIMSRLGSSKIEDTNIKNAELDAPDYSYLLLENRYRGGEDEISSRLEIYGDIFSGADSKVLEIGPGRGELQEIFKKRSIPSLGIDYDKAMVEVCKSKSFDVEYGDGLSYLSSLEDKSLGGLVAIQVVEHLTRDQLESLFELAVKKLKKDAKVVFETINPRSLLALSSNYFRDPTHIWPLHPDTLDYSMSLAGLEVLEVKNLSPVSESAQLSLIDADEYSTPRWKDTVNSINKNFEQINNLVYGFQDYCIIAKVRD